MLLSSESFKNENVCFKKQPSKGVLVNRHFRLKAKPW